MKTDTKDDKAVEKAGQAAPIRKIRLKDRRSAPARYAFMIDDGDI